MTTWKMYSVNKTDKELFKKYEMTELSKKLKNAITPELAKSDKEGFASCMVSFINLVWTFSEKNIYFIENGLSEFFKKSCIKIF